MATVVLTQLDPVNIPGVGELTSLTVFGWQITPATAQDLVTASETLTEGGYTTDSQCYPTPDGPQWTMLVTKPGYPSQSGAENDWIIFDGNTATIMTNAACAAEWTGNLPLDWAATTTAPIATANPDGSVTVVSPQPISANGPFTYTINRTNITTSTTDTVTPTEDQIAITDGTVTVTLPGLDAAIWSFIVTVDTQYDGVTATSAATNQVCLIPLAWDATTTAPTATAETGLSMQVIFPVPTCADGPFAYAYTLTDVTDDTAGATTPVTPTITDGNGAITIPDLTSGHTYSAVIAVLDSYRQTATSVASNQITATT